MEVVEALAVMFVFYLAKRQVARSKHITMLRSTENMCKADAQTCCFSSSIYDHASNNEGNQETCVLCSKVSWRIKTIMAIYLYKYNYYYYRCRYMIPLEQKLIINTFITLMFSYRRVGGQMWYCRHLRNVIGLTL